MVATGDTKTPLNRQAFLTFGDASWGTVKLGKDIGIFASDAILNDMTLLGVGGGFNNSGVSTTLVVSVRVTCTQHGKVKLLIQHLT